MAALACWGLLGYLDLQINIPGLIAPSFGFVACLNVVFGIFDAWKVAEESNPEAKEGLSFKAMKEAGPIITATTGVSAAASVGAACRASAGRASPRRARSRRSPLVLGQVDVLTPPPVMLCVAKPRLQDAQSLSLSQTFVGVAAAKRIVSTEYAKVPDRRGEFQICILVLVLVVAIVGAVRMGGLQGGILDSYLLPSDSYCRTITTTWPTASAAGASWTRGCS